MSVFLDIKKPFQNGRVDFQNDMVSMFINTITYILRFCDIGL